MYYLIPTTAVLKYLTQILYYTITTQPYAKNISMAKYYIMFKHYFSYRITNISSLRKSYLTVILKDYKHYSCYFVIADSLF